MKYATTVTLIMAFLFAACDKQTLKENKNDYSKNAINVFGDKAIISLISIKNAPTGFDPCFNTYFNAQLKESIRFTGGPVTREYANLLKGPYTLSYTCLHHCDDENESMTLSFEINDGVKKQTVIANRAGHCLYQLKLIVYGK